jgi:mannosyltransferase
MSDHRRRQQALAIMTLVLLVAAGLRLHLLGAQSLWYDEGVSFSHSVRDLPALTQALYHDIHAPLYFLGMGGWIDMAGTSEFALRFPSAMASVLTVALVYALGKRIFGPLAGGAAALLVTFNTFSLAYAQEFRMYAVLAAIGTAAMWAFVIWLGRGGSRPFGWRIWLRWAVALAVLNATGLYVHYAHAFTMLAQGLLFALWLVMLVWRRGRVAAFAWRSALTAVAVFVQITALTALLFLPWLPVALKQMGGLENIAPAVEGQELAAVISGWLTFGITYDAGMGSMVVAMLVLALFGLVILPRRSGRWDWWTMLLPVIWLLAIVGMYIGLDLTTRYLRFLLPAQAALALWLGRGIWVLWHLEPRHATTRMRRVTRGISLAVLGLVVTAMATSLPAFYGAPAYQRDDYRALVGRLQADLTADDVVILNAPGLLDIVGYYYTGPAPLIGMPRSHDPAITAADVAAIAADHPRIALVLYGQQEQDPGGVVERTLSASAYEIDDIWIDDMRLVRYAGAPSGGPVVAERVPFGDAIELVQAQVGTSEACAGSALRVDLTWRASAALDRPYKVFLQLLDADGALVAQRDSEPAGGVAPTTTWVAGEALQDRHGLLLPRDLAPGQYTLIAGLYDASDPTRRLPTPEGDFLELATIRVKAPDHVPADCG